ncbi:hypothetical protein K438DRAFT_2181592 [Mycena galopus ATCC 62051]|nr:hypothetical protein K438DRAFT_2181592 [Mycena galopus ATCC 62051]
MPCFEQPAARIFDSDSDHSLLGAPCVRISNPIATLVRCEGQLFLAVGSVTALSLGSQDLDEVDLSLLTDATAEVSFQIMQLIRASTADDPSQHYDWRWSNSMDGSILCVPGCLVQPLNPTLLINGTKPSYLFESAELLVITATLYEHLLPRTEFVESIPTINKSTHYPYRFGGEACFVCQGYENKIDSDQSLASCCPKCGPSVPLDLTKGPRLLEHFGAHQLHDSTINPNHEPCGLCGRAAPMCSFYLAKGRGANTPPTIDWARSTCRKKIIFQYAHAAKSNVGSRSPCSNVPVVCPICGPKKQAVWKYNLEIHLRNFHKLTDPAPHLVGFEISQEERSALEDIWKNRVPLPKHKRNHQKPKPLQISLAHSTIAILR